MRSYLPGDANLLQTGKCEQEEIAYIEFNPGAILLYAQDSFLFGNHLVTCWRFERDYFLERYLKCDEIFTRA